MLIASQITYKVRTAECAAKREIKSHYTQSFREHIFCKQIHQKKQARTEKSIIGVEKRGRNHRNKRKYDPDAFVHIFSCARKMFISHARQAAEKESEAHILAAKIKNLTIPKKVKRDLGHNTAYKEPYKVIGFVACLFKTYRRKKTEKWVRKPSEDCEHRVIQ